MRVTIAPVGSVTHANASTKHIPDSSSRILSGNDTKTVAVPCIWRVMLPWNSWIRYYLQSGACPPPSCTRRPSYGKSKIPCHHRHPLRKTSSKHRSCLPMSLTSRAREGQVVIDTSFECDATRLARERAIARWIDRKETLTKARDYIKMLQAPKSQKSQQKAVGMRNTHQPAHPPIALATSLLETATAVSDNSCVPSAMVIECLGIDVDRLSLTATTPASHS